MPHSLPRARSAPPHPTSLGRAAAILGAALALAVPATAQAAGGQAYCVAGPSSPPCPASFDANHKFATLTLAAAQIKANAVGGFTGDTVMVEPGTYSEAVVLQDEADVSIFGDPAHAERPLITWDGTGNNTTFVATSVPGLTLRHLDFAATKPNGSEGALFADSAVTLEDLHVSGASQALTINNHPATIKDVVVDATGSGQYPGAYISGQENATDHTIRNLTINAAGRGYGLILTGRKATVDGLNITATGAPNNPGASLPAGGLVAVLGTSLTLTHSRIAGGSNGLAFLGGMGGSNGAVTVSDSLLTAAGPASQDLVTTGLAAVPSAVSVMAGSATLTNVTAVATSAGSAGVGAAPGYPSAPLPASSVLVTNSIVRGGAQDLLRLPTGPMLSPAASIAADHTNYRPVSGDGVAAGAGNQSGDPLFVGPADFHVQGTSPTLQAGAGVPAGTTDLEGHARPTPAGGAPDLGAYESAAVPPGPPIVKQDPPPPPKPADRTAPTLSHLSLTNRTFKVGRTPTAVKARAALRATRRRRPPAKTSTIVRFTLSEKAAVSLKISRVTHAKRKKGSKKAPRIILKTVGTLLRANGRLGTNLIAFSGRIGKTRLLPGSYRITLVATDAAGNRSKAKTLTFRVVAR